MKLAQITARLRKRDTWIVIGGAAAAVTAVLAFRKPAAPAAASTYDPGFYGDPNAAPTGGGSSDSATQLSQIEADLAALLAAQPAPTHDTLSTASAPAPTVSPSPTTTAPPPTGYVGGKAVPTNTIVWQPLPTPTSPAKQTQPTGYIGGQPVSPDTIVWQPITWPVINTSPTAMLTSGYSPTGTPSGGGGGTLDPGNVTPVNNTSPLPSDATGGATLTA